MRYLLAIILVVVLIPSVSIEGAEREWVVTEPEGSCNRNGFEIQNETIQVTEDSIFSFNLFFRHLPERLVLRGNLIDGKTELTTSHLEGGDKGGFFCLRTEWQELETENKVVIC